MATSEVRAWALELVLARSNCSGSGRLHILRGRKRKLKYENSNLNQKPTSLAKGRKEEK